MSSKTVESKQFATLQVGLGERAYPIHIGPELCSQAGTLVRETLGDFARTVVLVSNPKVWKLYGAGVESSLRQAGIQTFSFLMGDGERFKTLRTAEKLWSFLIAERIERKAALLALGGGVVGDLTGFVAATYLRGIPYVQIPTTLLAQIDSSVGGKTAVNHPLGKNLVGSFHQPALVLADTNTLLTLPRREWQAGWCEALKYGVIRDSLLFERLEHSLPFPTRNCTNWNETAQHFLTDIITRCCEIKAAVVEADEREAGERKILNFGHTVGHALEAVTKYRHFRHGEAVGYGMIAACEIAVQLGLFTSEESQRVRVAVHQVGKLPPASQLDRARIIAALRHDKKAEKGTVRFILPTKIGAVVERTAPPDDILETVLQKAL
ncbi:MAG: 3-dehydroquinate synthase [Blastocatellia bacterium]|nr:3-dehydroquinate synthase [Blastocatellia bacterium]